MRLVRIADALARPREEGSTVDAVRWLRDAYGERVARRAAELDLQRLHGRKPVTDAVRGTSFALFAKRAKAGDPAALAAIRRAMAE
jgi:hypothetical protein